jgi:hypothetical protein
VAPRKSGHFPKMNQTGAKKRRRPPELIMQIMLIFAHSKGLPELSPVAFFGSLGRARCESGRAVQSRPL